MIDPNIIYIKIKEYGICKQMDSKGRYYVS